MISTAILFALYHIFCCFSYKHFSQYFDPSPEPEVTNAPDLPHQSAPESFHQFRFAEFRHLQYPKYMSVMTDHSMPAQPVRTKSPLQRLHMAS